MSSTICRFESLQEAEKFIQSHCDLFLRAELPAYLTELRSGIIRWASPSLWMMLGYDAEEAARQVEQKELNASLVYATSSDRDRWVASVRSHNRQRTQLAEFIHRVPDRELNAAAPIDESWIKRIFVVDICTLFKCKDLEDELAFGIIGDVTTTCLDLESAKRKVDAYREVLDIDRVNIGVHEIDREGRIRWMNRAERKLLGLDNDDGNDWLQKRPHVAELAAVSRQEVLEKKNRVAGKLIGKIRPTIGEHRIFPFGMDTRHPNVSYSTQVPGSSPPQMVPLNITDIPVPDPEPARLWRNESLVTGVLHEKLPPDIVEYLRESGPNNPILELGGVRICTFEKVKRKFLETYDGKLAKKISSVGKKGQDDDFVFTFGNRPFNDEVAELNRKSNHANHGGDSGDSRAKDAEFDVRGEAERELFPLFVADFNSADERVMASECPDERIEKHPLDSDPGYCYVHVLKIPLFSTVKGEGGEEIRSVIGVQGFYWQVDAPEPFEKIRALTKPDALLDDIPVPVYRKDKHLRFIYVNDAYIENMNQGREFASDLPATPRIPSKGDLSRSQIIGLTDSDLFSSKDAQTYEEDDRKLRDGGRDEIAKVELHRGRPVRVTKKAIRSKVDGDTVTAIQGIFWNAVPGEFAQYMRIRIDWGSERLNIGRIAIQLKTENNRQSVKFLMILLERLYETVDELTLRKLLFPDGDESRNAFGSRCSQMRKWLDDRHSCMAPKSLDIPLGLDLSSGKVRLSDLLKISGPKFESRRNKAASGGGYCLQLTSIAEQLAESEREAD
ncbi:PAS domain-containing protein [bacterium]|nr:PAS domain-containing protein [bacterium]